MAKIFQSLGNLGSFIGGAAGLLAIYFSYGASQETSRLETKLAETQLAMEQRLHEYDVVRNAYVPKVDGRTVVLIGAPTNDRQPDQLTVTPIFSNKNGSASQVGETFVVPVSLGQFGENYSEIRFDSILDSVCDYNGSAQFCDNTNFQIDQLIIKYTIDGLERSGVAEVPRS